jgi:hypothetical protein
MPDLKHAEPRSAPLSAMSSREFNQNSSAAKQAALQGPVFITDRGRPAHVLLCMEHYQRLLGNQGSIVDLLAQPGADDIEFDPPCATGLTRTVEF